MTQQQKNVSKEEIDKFNRFSKGWWDNQGSMKSLHDINPLRLDYIKAQTALCGKKILDVGCGGGLLTEKIAEQGALVTGIDHSAQMIEVAKQHAYQSGLSIQYIESTIEELTRSPEKLYDIILCTELLEHVPQFESIILACKKVLKPGGLVIFATINRNFLSFLLVIIGAEYVLGLLPKRTHHYNSLIKPSELIGCCNSVGFCLLNVKGFSYNPFTRNYYLCKNSWVNYFACFIGP